jgi:hypothetical protein
MLAAVNDDTNEFGMQFNVSLYEHDRVLAGLAQFGGDGAMPQVGKLRGLEQNAKCLAEGAWNPSLMTGTFYKGYLCRTFGSDALEEMSKAYTVNPASDVLFASFRVASASGEWPVEERQVSFSSFATCHSHSSLHRTTRLRLCGAGLASRAFRGRVGQSEPSCCGFNADAAHVARAADDRVSAWSDVTDTANNKRPENVTQSDPARRPLWVEKAIGGRPALEFDSGDFLNHTAANLVGTDCESRRWRNSALESAGTDRGGLACAVVPTEPWGCPAQ